MFAIEKIGKVWIISEAHGLRGDALSRLLTALEPAKPKHCCGETDKGHCVECVACERERKIGNDSR